MATRVKILCGGAGTRFDSDVPKPLNLVNGVPLIKHVVQNILLHCPNAQISFLYRSSLDDYGFKSYLENTFRETEFDFVPIDYQTRGPVESLFIGLSAERDEDPAAPFVIVDNDNMYACDFSRLDFASPFIGYTTINNGLTHYSFVDVDDDTGACLRIEERQAISNKICIGVYGFRSKEAAMTYCRKVLDDDHAEPFMSYMFKRMIEDGIQVGAVLLPDAYSLGTPKDILCNHTKLPACPIRVVFDLDNTLVSFPRKFDAGIADYSSCDPIERMRKLAKQLRKDGHRIIIYTARHAQSTRNVGEIVAKVGKTTLDSLQALDIPFDELHFGKPLGDVYIDDKAFNAYDPKLVKRIGFYGYDDLLMESEFRTNKYNRVRRLDANSVIKTSPTLQGEIFYYKAVAESPVAHLFPRFISQESDDSVVIEYIGGTTLAHIYMEGLLNDKLFSKFLSVVDGLHRSGVSDGVRLSPDTVHQHYDKFEARARNLDHYPFPDLPEVTARVRAFVTEFLASDPPLSSIIHGDCWFSNCMVYKGAFKFYDMRGKVGDIATVSGHAMYDWGKIYHSVVGLDTIIERGVHVAADVRQSAEKVFFEFLRSKNIDRSHVRKMAAYTLFSTFAFYDESFSAHKKELIWELVKELLV